MARFAKWCAVISSGKDRPSAVCIRVHAGRLACLAALSREAGLVPIVEPEVLATRPLPLPWGSRAGTRIWILVGDNLSQTEQVWHRLSISMGYAFSDQAEKLLDCQGFTDYHRRTHRPMPEPIAEKALIASECMWEIMSTQASNLLHSTPDHGTPHVRWKPEKRIRHGGGGAMATTVHGARSGRPE